MINFASNLNKMIDAGLGGPLDPPRTEVAVGHRVVYTEVSGDVVNFETNVIAPVKNLRVTMEPIQDLHGYDDPWPAGGKKNLFDEDTVYSAYKQADGSFILTGTQGNYTRTTIPEKYIGTQMTFSAIMRIPEGSSITNVRVGARISGTSRPGNSINDNTYARSSVTFTPETAEDYVFLSFGSNGSSTMQVKDIQLEVGSVATDYIPYSNICPITGRDIARVWREAEYDPSAAPAITIQIGQTVYGGTVDVTDGWCDDALMPVDLGSLTYTYTSSSGGYFSASVSDIALENYAVAACSCYQTVTSGGISAMPDMSIRSYTSGQIIIRDSRFTAPADLKAALSGQTAMCKRAIANKIQVTPTEMTTLKGQNNVWSDAGNISLEYPCYEETEGY